MAPSGRGALGGPQESPYAGLDCSPALHAAPESWERGSGDWRFKF